ncbi:HD-GYP domain-containing protein (plasmid) [Alteromonas macleodii]|uniref:HD-GYP domain-containing protein n=1 Tax=Alteromonas macleodii TaxID=28108 RepID=UPI0030D14FA0
MKKVINVDELKVGMYVTRVTKSNGSAIMTSKGVIKGANSIARLKSLKVKEVEIDVSRSECLGEEKPEETANPNSSLETTSSVAASPLKQELKSAKAMYEKAREVQRKAQAKIKAEGMFDTKEFELIAEEFFDSITRNQDALLCMTKLQDKDSYLLEHSINVGILLAIFAKQLGLNKKIGLRLTLAGLLHDIGKIKVPDDILFKNGKLTDEEFDEIKKHPQYGAEILTKLGVDSLAIQVALQHHERLAGNGYPFGLIAHLINKYVRMSCIVDVFDAMTAERVYKPAMTAFQVFKIMKKNGSEQYDMTLLNQFIRAIGLFSIGSVVQMESEKLAVVTATNHDEPLKPMVTLFYNAKHKRHIEIETINLSSKRARDRIEKVVNAADFGIDSNDIIKRLILNQ